MRRLVPLIPLPTISAASPVLAAIDARDVLVAVPTTTDVVTAARATGLCRNKPPLFDVLLCPSSDCRP
jgi:hypothetical protein